MQYYEVNIVQKYLIADIVMSSENCHQAAYLPCCITFYAAYPLVLHNIPRCRSTIQYSKCFLILSISHTISQQSLHYNPYESHYSVWILILVITSQWVCNRITNINNFSIIIQLIKQLIQCSTVCGRALFVIWGVQTLEGVI